VRGDERDVQSLLAAGGQTDDLKSSASTGQRLVWCVGVYRSRPSLKGHFR
jgi:hypothetical protein